MAPTSSGQRSALRLDDLAPLDQAPCLGRGASGRVVLAAVAGTGEAVAVKQLDRGRLGDPRLILNEKCVLMSLDHVGIVKLLGTDKDVHYLYMIFEYCSHGSMAQQIESHVAGFQRNTIRIWAYQTLSALRYLHEDRRLVHGDLKPANLLLDRSWNVKIADFGVARDIADLNRTRDAFGTEIYWAPEQIRRFHQARDEPLCEKIDVWAFGVAFYQIAFLDHPFRAGTDRNVGQRVLVVDDPVAFPNGADPDLVQLLQAALRKSAADRYDARRLLLLPFLAGMTDATTGCALDGDDDDELDGAAQALFATF